MIEGGEFPPNGHDLGKRTRGMVGPRIGGDGMGRGNGENITDNAKMRGHSGEKLHGN